MNEPTRPDFVVVDDEATGSYQATLGDREIAALTYDLVPDQSRVVLRATSVFPEFRHQGVATALIRHVLDDVRSRGMTVTIMCPIVRAFIENHPGYAELVNAEHPGVTRVATREGRAT